MCVCVKFYLEYFQIKLLYYYIHRIKLFYLLILPSMFAIVVKRGQEFLLKKIDTHS